MDQVAANTEKGLLRFLTCGSVDDGKSTLIGRLLFEQKLVLEDQMAALERDTRKYRPDEEIDYSLLVDGLEAVVGVLSGCFEQHAIQRVVLLEQRDVGDVEGRRELTRQHAARRALAGRVRDGLGVRGGRAGGARCATRVRR